MIPSAASCTPAGNRYNTCKLGYYSNCEDAMNYRILSVGRRRRSRSVCSVSCRAGAAAFRPAGVQRPELRHEQPPSTLERRVALDQCGEFQGRKGQGRDGRRRPQPGVRTRTGPRLEGLALRSHQGEIDLYGGRDRRIGRHPADLADPVAASTKPGCTSCGSTGTAKPSRRSNVRWATSSPAAGASIARSIRCPSASIPAAPSTATGRCRSARKRRSRWKISTTRTWFSTIR